VGLTADEPGASDILDRYRAVDALGALRSKSVICDVDGRGRMHAKLVNRPGSQGSDAPSRDTVRKMAGLGTLGATFLYRGGVRPSPTTGSLEPLKSAAASFGIYRVSSSQRNFYSSPITLTAQRKLSGRDAHAVCDMLKMHVVCR
jgi:hypothetical protein